MDTTFMNSENTETSDPHRLLHNLSHKINLKRRDKHVALSNLITYYTRKNIKCRTKTIDLKYQLQRAIIHLNYLMDHILYQIFKIILSLPSKNMK